MSDDPVCTDPDKYEVIFENDRVRVLEYRDLPGGKTHPHQHPDSVMYTLSGFRRSSRRTEPRAPVTAPEPAAVGRRVLPSSAPPSPLSWMRPNLNRKDSFHP